MLLAGNSGDEIRGRVHRRGYYLRCKYFYFHRTLDYISTLMGIQFFASARSYFLAE